MHRLAAAALALVASCCVLSRRIQILVNIFGTTIRGGLFCITTRIWRARHALHGGFKQSHDSSDVSGSDEESFKCPAEKLSCVLPSVLSQKKGSSSKAGGHISGGINQRVSEREIAV